MRLCLLVLLLLMGCSGSEPPAPAPPEPVPPDASRPVPGGHSEGPDGALGLRPPQVIPDPAPLWTEKTPNPATPEPSASAFDSAPTPSLVTDSTGERPRFVSVAELEAIESRARSAATSFAAHSGGRPVLRGTAIPGSGIADLISLVDGSPELAACEKFFGAEQSDGLVEYLWPPTPAELPPRFGRVARPYGTVTDHPLFRSAVEACSSAAMRLTRAVSHESAGSPYLPGRGPDPAHPIAILRVARGVACVARADVEAGRFAEAAALLLDGLRFLQDLERGGTNFFVAMMTAAGSLIVVSEIEAMLNAPTPLGDALLADLDRELSALMATETPAGRFLQAEVLSGLLYRDLPQVRGTEWVPPGGWAASGPPPADEGEDASLDLGPLLDRAEYSEFSALVMDSLGQMLAGTCPEEHTPVECADAVRAVASQAVDELSEAHVKVVSTMLSFSGVQETLSSVRGYLTSGTMVLVLPGYPKYLRWLGSRRFLVAALRVQAAYRRIADASGTCPTLAAFETAPLRELLKDPSSGKKIVVVALTTRQFSLTPPTPLRLRRSGEPDDQPTVVIECRSGDSTGIPSGPAPP
jgi:hypothetical protein